MGEKKKNVCQDPAIIFLGVFPSKSLVYANLEIYMLLSYNFMLVKCYVYPIVHVLYFINNYTN